MVVFGGEALDLPSLAPWFARHGDRVEMINMYGITETTVHVTYRPIRAVDVAEAPGSVIGVPLPDLGIALLDRAGRPTPVGVAGELFVCGAGLARGYLHRAELTAERFVEHDLWPGHRLYRTGDLARRLPGGDLEYLGRVDHQVKVRGFRVELGEIEAELNRHPSVRESVVVARDETAGDQRLIGYVVARPERQRDRTAVTEQVDDWTMVFDQTYGQDPGDTPKDFNIIGWNSAYTNAPIPADEMRSWVDATVRAVTDLRPRRVLELGCGTGLLLSRIAPGCDVYDGVDISPVVLDYLRREVLPADERLARVRLFSGAADDLSALPDQRYDLILINSVAQYFPDAGYLTGVLDGALDRLADGGALYVGDIRDLTTHRTFHTTVELAYAPAEQRLSDLTSAVDAAIDRDNELVLSPAFFTGYRQDRPRLCDVRIRHKRGRYVNELTQFRYDVVLVAGPATPVPTMTVAATTLADGGVRTADGLAALLAAELPERHVVTGLVNRRLAEPLAIADALAAPDQTQRVATLRRRAREADATAGVDPEDFLAIADRLPYRVEALHRADDPGRFDVVVSAWHIPMTALPPAPTASWSPPAPTVAAPGGADPIGDARPVASDPIRARLRDRLVTELFGHLEGRLPRYMVPTSLLLVDAIPLTPHGKTDRRALPTPPTDRRSIGRYDPPRTQTERRVADLFAQVLGVRRVGLHDDFFDLGGHSLLATRLMLRLREVLGIEVPLVTLFAAPTVAAISEIADGTATTATTTTGPDLGAEVRLDDDIRPAHHAGVAAREDVFLTGGTGFVGAFLLRAILDATAGQVHCLVRAASYHQARQRLTGTLRRYQLSTDGIERAVPVLGDLAAPRLGLDETEAKDLAERITAIYHNGAMVNFSYPYRTLAPANVDGTREVLRLACQADVPVHFISSLYVFGPGDMTDGPVDETAVPADWPALRLGYTQTKWVAERLVAEAAGRGLASTVFRLGRVGGDSGTGACQTGDFLWLLIKAGLEVGALPDLDLAVDLVPADFVAAAVVRLAQRPQSVGQVFHLRNVAPQPLTAVARWLRDAGWPVRITDPATWRDLITRHGERVGPGSAAYKVLPLLDAGDSTGDQLAFTMADTEAALADTGLRCPPISQALLGRYLDFFVKDGFLPAPDRSEGTR